MGTVEEMICVVYVSVTEERGHSADGCVFASTLCKYDLRKCDLFILGWARVRLVRLHSACDGCCIFCLYCDAWSCRC